MGMANRRGFIASLALAGLAPAARAQTPAAAPPASPPRFGFEDVVRRARDLSTAPLAPIPALPEPLARLDPALAREIRFRPERAFLAGDGSQFRLETMHLDARSARPVTVNLIRDGIATPIPYAASLFDYGKARFEKPLPLNLGFAGFRLRFPLNDPRAFDDTLVFTSASPFKFLGRGQRVGALLRALTVNAGMDNEEFPFFREFWIQAPEANAARATIFALLDGDSVTGAFRFDVSPGDAATLDVAATIFPRRLGGQLGLAPIASLFLSGENDRRLAGDFRPEIHDSDGLALHTGAGERVWRPLRNPAASGRFSFLDKNPRGFGLIQRDRAFDHYQDLKQAYERRPSYWVEPMGDWGAGRVELLETPATDAGGRNILVSWVGAEGREPGKPINIAYRVRATLGSRAPDGVGHVVNTFQSSPESGGEMAGATARRFMVDFAGGDLGYFTGDSASVEIVATISAGRVSATALEINPHIEGFRANVDVEVPPGVTADVRVALRAGPRAVSETWTLPFTG